MKKQYLLDTNICGFLFRGKYGVDQKIRQIGIDNCHLSIITYAELYYGCERSSDFDYNFKIMSTFCDNIDIIGIDDVIPRFCKEKVRLKQEGNLIEDFDILIGATALEFSMTMVTENVEHLGRLEGIQIENWIQRNEQNKKPSHDNGIVKK